MALSAKRRGTALLLALTLIILAIALLTGTAHSAKFAALSTASREASILAEARWRTEVAAFMNAWDSPLDSLVIGSEVQRVVGPTPIGTHGAQVVTHLRLLRLDRRLFVLGVSTQIGPDDAVQARRSASLLLEYAPVTDSSAPLRPPVPTSKWAQHKLY